MSAIVYLGLHEFALIERSDLELLRVHLRPDAVVSAEAEAELRID